VTPGFQTPLRTELIRYPLSRLLAPLVYRDKHGVTWIVQAGFVSDAASIPMPFRAVLPRHGHYTRAAWLHDWLFVTRPLSLRHANNLMLEAMAADRVPLRQRLTIRAGLLVGSWLPWRRDTVHPENEKFRHVYQ
jgi:hypothetical protein